MSASSDGLTDDIYSEVCDFSYLGGGCGISHHYSSTPNILFKVYECTKPTTIHLKRLNSSKSCDFPEGLFILYRTGIFSIDATTTQLSICPKHRDFYGIHWKNKSARCQHPDHPSSSKAKADRGSSPLLCKQNWLYTRQIIPVGTGLCKQCSIKMKNFVKSDKTQVKLNIEEDVEAGIRDSKVIITKIRLVIINIYEKVRATRKMM
ncbi:uncharacterized protein [Mytilus edulis]|uniref:uncharacterized protein n=1 Tax=Mytilus edulis TaxID=6550 RepID=UPI0039EED5FE